MKPIPTRCASVEDLTHEAVAQGGGAGARGRGLARERVECGAAWILDREPATLNEEGGIVEGDRRGLVPATRGRGVASEQRARGRIGAARIVVEPGFDAEHLRAVVAALRERGLG
jgi:hypothetical protein